MDTTAASSAAAAAVAAAGFTPCSASAFVSDGRAFAFSEESVDGTSASGPAFSVVVDVASGAVTSTGGPRSQPERGDEIVEAWIWDDGYRAKSRPAVFVRRGARIEALGAKQGHARTTSGESGRFRIYRGEQRIFRADEEELAIALARHALERCIRGYLAARERNGDPKGDIQRLRALVEERAWETCPVQELTFDDRAR